MSDPTTPGTQGSQGAISAQEVPVSQGAKQPTGAQPTSDAASDLASLLSEFEASTAPKAPEPPQAPAAQAPQAEAKDPAAFDPVATAMAGFNDWQKANLLEGEVKVLNTQLEAARQRIDYDDFNKAVAAGERMLQDADLLVPDGFVRDKLLAMSVEFPESAQIFDHRAENPKAYERAMKKVNHKIYEAARSMPDPEISENRAAVAAAVRGASTKVHKEEAPRYGDMNDAEFAKEKAKFGL